MNKHIIKNDEALAVYLKSISSDMLRVAYSYFPDDSTVDEVISETIYRVYKYRKKVKNSEFLKSWIIRILINECKTEYNRKSNLIEINEGVHEFVSNDEFAYVYDYIRFLDPPQYDIVMLKTMNDYTFSMIAQIIDMKENTVKTQYYRAVDVLRKEFRDYE